MDRKRGLWWSPKQSQLSQLSFETTDVYIKNPKTFLLQKLAVMDHALAKLRETSLAKKT